MSASLHAKQKGETLEKLEVIYDVSREYMTTTIMIKFLSNLFQNWLAQEMIIFFHFT